MNSKFRRKSGSINDTRIAGLYDLEHTIGKGHFAVVKLARHVFTGEKVAVKVIDKTKMQEDTRKYMMQEVRCMKLVQHPNIVRLYEVIDTQTKLFLILELGDYDMYDYIMKNLDKGCKESDAQQYFSQIIKAIDYCHTLHVVHRDLKLENVVFFEKLGMVKLTDFGFSNLYTPGQQLNTSCGSLAYSAPEILLGDAYDPTAVDIWSLGVILYMLVCGRLPFQEANESETLTKILDCRFTLPDHLSTPCKHLISRILVRDPKKRATISEIIQSSWVIAGDRGFAEVLPLIVKDHLPDSAHSTIIEQMIAGGIGEEEEILKAIENDDYSYITATYYLLAERVLASYREEQANRLLCAIQTPSDDKEIFDNEHNFSCTATVSGGFQTRSRSNSWRGASSKRAFTILKEESEEELSSYLRSSSRQSSRNSSPSVSMFGGLHSSRDRISPQAIQELLEFSRTSGIRRAASPDSRFSSRSPSPPTSSGRTSPAFSGIVSGIARLKSSMITSTSGMRKLSSSPHLLGICEESEDLTDSNASPFYANTSKSGFQKSSPGSKGHLTRNNRSASTGFPSSVTARLQKMSTITNNDVFDNPSTSTATSSRSNSITSLQTYGSARVVRPRQAVVSPDMCRRYEQHQRFVTRSRKSTSCSSSETSDDDTNERKWSLIGSKYCKRNPDDPKPDEDPPKGGTGGGNFHGSLSVKMTIPESETNGNHEQESTTNADDSNNGTKSNKNGNMNRWDSLELLDSCSTYGRYSGVLQPILEHPPDSLLYDRAAFIRCRMFNKSETAREALHDWLQESQVFNDYEVEEYDNYRDKFVNSSPPKFGHMKRASLNPSASSPFYRSLTRSRSLDSTFRSMHDSISNGSRSLMDSRSDSICLDLSDKEDMQISMISDSSSTTIDSGCSSDDEPDQTGITIKFPMNYSPSSLKKPKIDFQENIYKVCQ